jgi:hypothetical protein
MIDGRKTVLETVHPDEFLLDRLDMPPGLAPQVLRDNPQTQDIHQSTCKQC